MSYESYESPFCTRYSSREMQYIFSAENKFRTFRRLWIALARAEQKLGLNITDEQIAELEKYKDDINFDVAEAREKEVRHDVMAHVFAYGEQAKSAKPIIHLGATSCYVGDNTDIIVMKQGLELIRDKLVTVIKTLADFAYQYKDMACLAYTHLQPAQPTTVGKRATLWVNELMLDLDELEFRIDSLKLLGQKGTTGTQASFVELFGDEADEKTPILEKMIAEEMGFTETFPVSGQTYSRKVDAFICNTLAGIAESAMKFANDLRILANFKEMEEPFEKNQIGSSAMPYKRNPMRSERICAIARYVMTNSLSPAFTAGTQWFERTLDDSANKRIAVSEAFLGIDAILNIFINVSNGLVVYPKIVRRRLMNELPFMATENIMMAAVKKGGDRQELHEKIRQHSVAAAKRVKEEGAENDLLERIAADEAFFLKKDEIAELLNPDSFVGRAPKQTEEYLNNVVYPRLKPYIESGKLMADEGLKV
ncbi:MAG: adenylosuccinate lyase [Ruminococcaceae bacterium]|nr:adenylosuccinate lyase [Oscillospiraceae bacterium]